jgi:hypothetical protein
MGSSQLVNSRFISSSKSGILVDETFKMNNSSSKQCIFEEEQGPRKRKASLKGWPV